MSGPPPRECCRPDLILVDRARGCRQELEGPQAVGLRLVVDAGQHRRHAGGRPHLEPFADVAGRPGDGNGIDERIGHPADRLELLAAEVQLLEGARIAGESVPADEVVVEVFGLRPHAAHVQSNPGLQRLPRVPAVSVDAHRHVGGATEGSEGSAGDPRARLEFRAKQIHVIGSEEGGDPAIGELTGQAQAPRGERRQVDRHRLAHRPRQELEAHVELKDITLEEQAVAPQNLANDRDRLPHADQRLIEGHTVPAWHRLVATGSESEDEPAPGDQVERRRRLRQEGGRPAEYVDDARAELDAFGAGGESAQDGDGIGAIRFGHPDRFEAEGLSALSELNRLGERETSLIGQGETELHRGILRGPAPRVDDSRPPPRRTSWQSALRPPSTPRWRGPSTLGATSPSTALVSAPCVSPARGSGENRPTGRNASAYCAARSSSGSISSTPPVPTVRKSASD